jgi:hypothetical protein
MGVYTTINDPSAYFQTATWTGDGNSTKAITNDGNSNLQPDWVWLKNRTDAENHTLADTSRGVTQRLVSNSTAAQDTNGIASVQSDGFTVQLSYNGNTNAKNYVAWQWKANGGTTSSNSSGSITSTVQANTTAGFSVVTYTGTGSNATVGHGLGTSPQIVLIKKYSSGGSNRAWIMYLEALGNTKALFLNDSDPEYTLTDAFNSTSPTSTTFSIGTNGRCNDSGESYVAYCFETIQGYSQFGKYEGNGDDDGPFIYTGFKPAFLIIKRTDASNNWWIMDTKRDDYQNPVSDLLIADNNDAENADTARLDYTANGFKWRVSPNAFNADGGQYVYLAFAESPFVSSAGVPTTAK